MVSDLLCPVCNEPRDESLFAKAQKSCRHCRSRYRAEYRLRPGVREHEQEVAKRWREKNRVRLRAASRRRSQQRIRERKAAQKAVDAARRATGLYTIKEASGMLGLQYETVRHQVYKKLLSVERNGRRVYVRIEEVEQYRRLHRGRFGFASPSYPKTVAA